MYEFQAEAMIINKYGKWRLRVYKHKVSNKEHIALISVGADINKPILVRIHSSCITGDVFYSEQCDCREQLDEAMVMIGKEHGIILYLFQEGRNIGLTNKIRAYALKERGFDTYEANRALGLPDDNRNYSVAGEILDDLGIKNIKLMTNNPNKINAIKKMGIKVERISDEIEPTKYNHKYLSSKKKNGHILKKIK